VKGEWAKTYTKKGSVGGEKRGKGVKSRQVIATDLSVSLVNRSVPRTPLDRDSIPRGPIKMAKEAGRGIKGGFLRT